MFKLGFSKSYEFLKAIKEQIEKEVFPLKEYDAIIVGAGTAGCLAAKTTAEAGLIVCLIEKTTREEIGEKICGDALGEHHLKTVGLDRPHGDELEKRIEGVKIY